MKKRNNLSRWLIVGLLIFCFGFIIRIMRKDDDATTKTEYQKSDPFAQNNSDIYKFKLTELLGKEMNYPAIFEVDSKSVNWTLDYEKGTDIYYNILTINEYTPLCGIKAKDNNGDYCEICITNEGGNNVSITFNYSAGKLIYKGRKL